MADTTPTNKTKEERLAELAKRLAEPNKAASKPFITTDGKMDKEGRIVLLVDVLALEDGYKESTSGKSNVNFQSIDLKALGRLNINAIKKV